MQTEIKPRRVRKDRGPQVNIAFHVGMLDYEAFIQCAAAQGFDSLTPWLRELAEREVQHQKDRKQERA